MKNMNLHIRCFIFLFLSFHSMGIFAQSDELRKISKYVVARKDASCLYKDPNFESLILKECPMPEPEEKVFLFSLYVLVQEKERSQVYLQLWSEASTQFLRH